MAKPSVVAGEDILIKLETAPASGVFAHPCLINGDRGVAFSANMNESIVPDCDDPSAPAWIDRNKDGLSVSISGSGVLDKTDIATWDAWMQTDASKLVRVYVSTDGYWEGNFKLTGLTVSGARKNNATVDVTIVSDGEVSDYTAA